MRSLEKPIIVVPSRSSGSILNINNVKKFLVDQQFAVVTEGKPLGKVEIEFTPKSGHPIRMQVVDNVNDLRQRDWQSVVAVFAQGQEWQFKNFPSEWGGVAGIFHQARGFYVHFDDEKVPTVVTGWNVKTLSVSKTKRHLDGTAAAKFWEEMEFFMRQRGFLK
jgi:hypothetical protein